MTFPKNHIKFPGHTQEKLDGINYYYKTWFKIVKGQKAYIIDAFSGTGYVEIEGDDKIVRGSALLAVDLLKKDDNHNLKLNFINIQREECNYLRSNISDYISKNKINLNTHTYV